MNDILADIIGMLIIGIELIGMVGACIGIGYVFQSINQEKEKE